MDNSYSGTSLMDLNSNSNYETLLNGKNNSNRMDTDDDYIKNISNEILEGLNTNNISLDKPIKSDQVKLNEEIETKKKIFDNVFKNYINLKDFFVIFVLYVILSFDFVKDFFANIFTQLNADDEGKVGFTGVLIYGLILAVLFVIVKLFL